MSDADTPLDELLDEPEPDEPGARCRVCGPAPACSCRTEELNQRDYRTSSDRKTRRLA